MIHGRFAGETALTRADVQVVGVEMLNLAVSTGVQSVDKVFGQGIRVFVFSWAAVKYYCFHNCFLVLNQDASIRATVWSLVACAGTENHQSVEDDSPFA